VPGGELAFRARGLALGPGTLVVVNCAGRTRSIIGAQSLINVGLHNRVAALENGTIGWSLAGLPLDHGASATVARPLGGDADVRAASRRWADRCRVGRTTAAALQAILRAGLRTCYRFDVRSAEEYEAGHAAGFRWAPGGQLVQETDYFAPVRGAMIALVDDDGVRANMAGSWLAQMGWDVAVVEGPATLGPVEVENGPWCPTLPPLPGVATTTVGALVGDAARPGTTVIELGAQAAYLAGHIDGSWWARREDLPRLIGTAGSGTAAAVLVSEDDRLARYAVASLPGGDAGRITVLQGGKAAWRHAGQLLLEGQGMQFSLGGDAYRRPYEGAGNDSYDMRAYIEWELGLVDQLARDGAHGFSVVSCGVPSPSPS
jgi:rhodanese-related sulfurtransferase